MKKWKIASSICLIIVGIQIAYFVGYFRGGKMGATIAIEAAHEFYRTNTFTK